MKFGRSLNVKQGVEEQKKSGMNGFFLLSHKTRVMTPHTTQVDFLQKYIQCITTDKTKVSRGGGKVSVL